MKIAKLMNALSVLLILLLNITPIFGQSANNNDLLNNDIQALLSNTQRSVQAYLQTILVDAIIQNVNSIFQTASLNLTNLINKSYVCSKLMINSNSTSTTPGAPKTITTTSSTHKTTTTTSTAKITSTTTTRTSSDSTSTKTTTKRTTSSCTYTNKVNNTFIFTAVQMNDTNLLNSLLCLGSNINVLKTFGPYTFTPLMWAVYNNQFKMTNTLIQLGANIQYQEPSTSSTILDWAFYNNEIKMINLLIEAGAKFNTTENVDERSMIPNTLIRPYYSDIAFRDSLILTQNERKTLHQMYEMDPAREA